MKNEIENLGEEKQDKVEQKLKNDLLAEGSKKNVSTSTGKERVEAEPGKVFTPIIKFVLIVVMVLVGVILGSIYGKYNQSTDKTTLPSEKQTQPELRAKLVEEFRGAYEEDIVPNGKVVEIKMVAEPTVTEIFDGVKTKVWAYNGTVPGPQLRIKLGDTLKVDFTNKLPQETTIHFHGVRVPNAMDGVPGVTQPPIKPGEKFVYEFTPKDPGTYWFHPHVRSSEQVERGLFGTLVVEEPIDEQYSQDQVWVIDDWRLTNDKQVYEEFNTPMDLMHDGRWGNVITVNAKLQEELIARPGERIRLRLVNASNARVYLPKFENLTATIIATDGMLVKRTRPLGDLELSPGNRIDLDITIPTNANGREFALTDDFGRQKITLAKIKVRGEKVSTPEFDFPTNAKVPDWSEATKVEIDKEYRLNARRKAGGEGMGMMGQIEWTINGKAYPEYDPFTFKYEKFNTFSFINESSRLHPMHLHGQFFKVIARNGVPVDEGFFRDTVLINPKEKVDLALVPLDKGKWVSHCHILEHAEAGMMTAVTVE